MSKFTEALHPRGKAGKFIKKGGGKFLKKSSKKGSRLKGGANKGTLLGAALGATVLGGPHGLLVGAAVGSGVDQVRLARANRKIRYPHGKPRRKSRKKK